MIKFKKNIFIFFVFVILFTPVKKVYLEVLEQDNVVYTYNNYYFFVEPFSEGYANHETVNSGLFAPPRLGHFNDNLELVKLKKNSDNSDNDVIDTYYKFYKKKDMSLGPVKFVYFRTVNGQEQYCLLASYEINKSNNVVDIYYTHGCYKNTSGWRGYYYKENGQYCTGTGSKKKCIDENTVVVSERDDAENFKYACASVDRFSASGASIVKITSSNDGIYSGDNYYIFEITRAPLKIVDKNVTIPDGDYSRVKIGDTFGVNANYTSCPNTDERMVNPIAVEDPNDPTMYSPVLGKYSYNVSYYGCKEKDVDLVSNCNSSKNINQSCSKTTIELGDNSEANSARADFSMSQTGTLSNILTPSSIYQGGGINLGFTYYNTVNWKYESEFLHGSNLSDEEAKNSILSAIKSKIRNVNEVESNLSVNFTVEPSIQFTNDINNNLIKKCEQTVTGDFNNGSITTVCTVFLPVTNIQPYTGKISGVTAIEGNGVNNKIYTELSYYGILNFGATVSGLNVIKGDSDWSIRYNPNNDDTSCQVDVYSRLYAERQDGSDKFNKHKFIYRPIDLNNPFPNRVAGANWYVWYSSALNRERLRESYTKLQYRVELNPTRVAEIKQYNSNKNYLDWDGFENGQSDFINTEFRDYFDVVGQNIVGDSS